jgi:hypothetical protein
MTGETHYCRVCGQPVDPTKDVMFGAAGRPLFAAHEGACADKVRQGAGLLGDTLRGLLRQKAPRASAVFETAAKVMSQVQQAPGKG